MVKRGRTTVTEDDIHFVVTGGIGSSINEVAGRTADDDIITVACQDGVDAANGRIGGGGGEDATIHFKYDVTVVTQDNVSFDFHI